MNSRAPTTSDNKAGSDFLGAAGLILSMVAWTHAFLILFPPHFGVAQWEYAAATQTIDVFPLAVMGMALLANSAITRAWNRRSLALILACIASTLLLISVGVLILLDLLVAWNSVTASLREQLLKGAFKALFFAFMFSAFFVWVAVRLKRARRTLLLARR